MAADAITFDDGAAYERFMGRWSLLAGEAFLRWLAPEPGLRWADIGCGNGAFTELLFRTAAAAEVDAIDPSPGQLAFARDRLPGRPLRLHQGGAADLPFSSGTVDAAVMALVIFFVPVPEAGLAEMVRIVRPGGLVCAYAWDIPGGGFPSQPVAAPLRAAGIEPPRPPRADISTLPELTRLWTQAGLQDVRTHVIEVEREFEGFDEWWSSLRAAPSMAKSLAPLAPPELARLQEAMRRCLPADAAGRIRTRARANAVMGRKPAA